MFKDKTVKERKALIIQKYNENLEKLYQASEVQKNCKKFLVILRNQLAILEGLDSNGDN